MLPGFDPVQPPLLLLWRQAVERVQPVYQSLLLLGRKLAKLWIALQSLLLVRKRETLMRPQPVTTVFLPGNGGTWHFVRLRAGLRWAGNLVRLSRKRGILISLWSRRLRHALLPLRETL